MTWLLRTNSDGRVLIQLSDAPVTGLSRLDIDERNFAEFAAHDPSHLVAVGADGSPAGQQLLTMLVGEELAKEFTHGRVPHRAIVKSPPLLPSTVAELGRVTQMLHLAEYDLPRTRPLWHLEALATYTRVNRLGLLPAIPDGVDAASLAELPAALAGRALDPDMHAVLADLVAEVLDATPIDELVRRRLRSALVSLRTGSHGDVADAIDDFSGWVVGASLSRVRSARRTVRADPTLGGAGQLPALAINRRLLPRWLEVGWGATVHIEPVGTAQQITMTRVPECSRELWLRAYTPATEDGRPGLLLAVTPLRHDEAAHTLTARLDLVADDLEFGPVLLDIVDASSRFDPLPVEWTYWAEAVRSDLVTLRLLTDDGTNRAVNGINEARRALSANSARLPEPDRADFLVTLPPLGFVTPRVSAR